MPLTTRTSLPSRLHDEMADTYLCWRKTCIAVEDAYEGWRIAARGERALRYAAYRAALDRERQAATEYEATIARLSAG